jgi:hypothetical protein
MNLPFEKSPRFCRVRQTVRLRFEFGGVEIFVGLEKRQAGQVGHNLYLRWLSGLPLHPELIKGRGHSFDKISQAGDRRSQAINHNLYRQNYPGS